MPLFKNWFPSKKHKSTCRGPQPSASGTATARSTKFPSPKALPNGVGPVKEAEGIISPVKQKQHNVSYPLPAVSQSSVGTSSATTTQPTYFAPLEQIDRPRTANSNKTPKLYTPRGLETGRPATSHAAATTNPKNHKVEASYVESKPASAYSNPPQPGRSACSPYQASPTILDGTLHPALRKTPEIGTNAHRYTTQGRTEYQNLRKSPGRGQFKPQFGESGQRRAAETSATSTQGQKPDEPSPPPLSQAKRSSPSHVVSSGTSSSPSRNQQPRQCRDDDQRRGANATNPPTQRQELHEPTPPLLPPRPKATESSRSGSSSTLIPTIRSSFSRGSTASTEFLDTEGEAAIAFQDIDVLALLGSALGASRCSFDWNLGEWTFNFAKRCMRELERYDRNQSVVGCPYRYLCVSRKLMSQ